MNQSLDPFALLQLPRRPYLDPELLDKTVRHLAAKHHPDHSTGSAEIFEQLQRAATQLRQPANRLRFLAKREDPISFPAAAATLFQSVGRALHNAREITDRYRKASGVLAKALLMKELLAAHATLTAVNNSLQEWQQSLHDQLLALDSAWPKVTSLELLTLANSFTFAQRWEDQLRERKVALAILLG